MMRNDRPPDQSFRWYQRLYYRCHTDDVVGDRLLPLRIRPINLSVNWSKYSKPWDVIFGQPNAGIAVILVSEIRRDLPEQITADDSKNRDKPKPRCYRPWHDPYDDNYGHTEIAVYKEEDRLTNERDINSQTKKAFRQILSDRSRVVRLPRTLPT